MTTFMNSIGYKKLAISAAMAVAGFLPGTVAQAHQRVDIDRGRIEIGGGHDGFHFDIDLSNDPRIETRTDRVWVEPVYRTVTEHVWVDPVYRTVTDRVWQDGATQDVVQRVWVEPVYQDRQVVTYTRHGRIVSHQQVCVSPGHWEDRHTTVAIGGGHWEDVQRQELVTPGHYEDVTYQELVTPGHWEQVTVAPPWRNDDHGGWHR